MLMFGPLADVVPIEWLLIPTGILLAVESIAMGRNKDLMLAG